MKRKVWFIVACLLLLTTAYAQDEQAQVSLRVLWFDDTRESEILQVLIDEFEQLYPYISLEIDITPQETYFDIELIRGQIDSGNAPDLARHTFLSGFKDDYLDLRPYLENAADWDVNFPPALLSALRDDPTDGELHGIPTDITLSAPFINRSMWEQAGVPIPSDTQQNVSWQTWIDGAQEVQRRLQAQGQTDVYAFALDRSGHRFWGMSLGYCANYFDADGNFTVDNEGFRTAANNLAQWHIDGTMPLEGWAAFGDGYLEPDELFTSGRVPLYYSGNWQLLSLKNDIGDSFVWQSVQNPVSDEGCMAGMVGGSVLTAFKQTQHPEEVGLFMSYFTRPENLARFYTHSEALPGYLPLADVGLDYENNAQELNRFADQLDRIQPDAFALQYNPRSSFYHSTLRLALIDMIVQELTLEETESLINAQIAQAGG